MRRNVLQPLILESPWHALLESSLESSLAFIISSLGPVSTNFALDTMVHCPLSWNMSRLGTVLAQVAGTCAGCVAQD